MSTPEQVRRFVDATLDESGIAETRDESFRAACAYGPDAGLAVWEAWAEKHDIELTDALRETWRSAWRR